jgi:hypothetical protein
MPKPSPKSTLTGLRVTTFGPWWLDAADASCPHCLQGYAHGLHYRCAGCDGEVCAHCVIELRAEVEFVCPICDDGSEESS